MIFFSLPRRAVLSTLVYLVSILLGVLFFLPSLTLSSDDHACKYLNEQEVQQILGFSVEVLPGPVVSAMGQSSCHYDGGNSASIILDMTRSAWVAESKFKAKDVFEFQKMLYKKREVIKGLGDEAYWTNHVEGVPAKGVPGSLNVLSKDTYFKVSVLMSGKDDKVCLQKSQEVAKLLLSKLP